MDKFLELMTEALKKKYQLEGRLTYNMEGQIVYIFELKRYAQFSTYKNRDGSIKSTSITFQELRELLQFADDVIGENMEEELVLLKLGKE